MPKKKKVKKAKKQKKIKKLSAKKVKVDIPLKKPANVNQEDKPEIRKIKNLAF